MKNTNSNRKAVLAYVDFLRDSRLSLAAKSASLIFKTYEGKRYTGKEFAKLINVSDEQFCSIICELISAGYISPQENGDFEITDSI